MSKIHIFSDFDGTITEKDTLVFLATRLGGGPQLVETIGRLIREGELSLRDGIAGEMRSIRRPFDEAVELLRREVQIDPGFPPFARWCEEQGTPLTILSAGFHELIDLFLPSHKFPNLTVLANHLQPDEQTGWRALFRDDTPHGHDKAEPLRAARNRGEYVIFIGDGLSDRPAAEAADEVFAKHSLAEYCQARGINYHEFKTFDDVLKQMEEKLRNKRK